MSTKNGTKAPEYRMTNDGRVILEAHFTQDDVLDLLEQGLTDRETMKAWMADRELAARSAGEAAGRAQSGGGGKIYFKVSRKGALSIYGLQRMPVTLYAEQWVRLFAHREQVEAFIASDPTTVHEATEASKDGKVPAKPKQTVKLAYKVSPTDDAAE